MSLKIVAAVRLTKHCGSDNFHILSQNSCICKKTRAIIRQHLATHSRVSYFYTFLVGCWTVEENTNVLRGEANSANSVQDCQSACVNNASCNGVDWNPGAGQKFTPTPSIRKYSDYIFSRPYEFSQKQCSSTSAV